MTARIVCTVFLACLFEAVSVCNPDALDTSCPASGATTGGTALLQLTGSVGKRAPAKGGDEPDLPEGVAELQQSSEAKNSDEKRPKKDVGFDFKSNNNNNNNNDVLNMGNNNNNNNNNNLNMNNNNDADFKELSISDNDNIDFNNNDDKDDKKSDKKGKGKKDKDEKADNGFDFGNNNNNNNNNDVGSNAATNNFDFGEGKIASEATSAAAVAILKSKVDKAVGKVTETLNEAAEKEKTMLETLKKLNTEEAKSAEEVKYIVAECQMQVEEANKKVQEAKKELQELTAELAADSARSAAHLDGSPRSWLLACACLCWLCRLF